RLNYGRYGEDLQKRLFSQDAAEEMWSPQTIINIKEGGRYNTHFMSYGLGWFLKDVDGYKEVYHTGGLLGIVTKVLMIPEKDLGIIVLTNRMIGAPLSIMTKSIRDSYLDKERVDCVGIYYEIMWKKREKSHKIVDEVGNTVKSNKEIPDLVSYAGTYHDSWFVDINIYEKDGSLYFEAKKATDFTGKMYYYNANTFVIKWDNRTFIADAYIMFNLNKEGEAVSATMKPISPRTDFSFDFKHLSFKRVKEEN